MPLNKTTNQNTHRSQIIRRFFSAFLVFIFLFSFNLPSALAFSYPSPVSAMNSILKDLGVDKAELKYNIKTLNVARQKKQPPLVSLNFSPANPAPGKKVTAIATPLYFINETKDLYFTWFLKSAGCSDNNDKNYSYSKKCDLDNNGRVNIEDYKIKAARIIANNDFEWDKASYSKDSDDDGYKAISGGNDQTSKNDHCFFHNVATGNEFELSECNSQNGHLFPDAPGEKTGDSSFGKDEEKFWHTNPDDPDTADTGNGDEANIAGLGINSFSWNYTEGDQIGLAVEGVSIEPTQYADSSYKIMWALLNNKCDLTSEAEDGTETTTSTVTTPGSPDATHTTTVETVTTEETTVDKADSSYTVETTVDTTTTETLTATGEITATGTTSSTSSTETSDLTLKKVPDLNKCLYENLIDPMEGGGSAEKLDVSLSYSPQFPMNDPAGQEGDMLTISSSVINAKNNDYLNYNWQVFSVEDPNPDSWGNQLLKSDLAQSSQTSGLGINTFKFKLGLANPKKYLRVKLTVLENISKNVTREGHSDVVIPISSTLEKIKVFTPSVSDALQLSLSDTERCKEGINQTICPVVKSEIIGLKVDKNSLSDFLWTVNGDPIAYSECFFDGCNLEKQTEIAYFPILESKGFRYDVNLTATNQKTGEKVNLNKTFEVVDPTVSLVSADEELCRPVLLGYYVDLDGKKWEDYSQNNFIALSSSPIKIKPIFSGFAISSDNYYWTVDGNPVNKSNAESFGYGLDDAGVLTLTDKLAGEYYNVGFKALYTQDNKVKKMLNQYWQVSYGEFYDKTVENSIQIQIADSLPDSASAQGPVKKVFANIFSAVPSYLVFLIRIVLTTGLIIFASRIILSLFPHIEEDEI